MNNTFSTTLFDYQVYGWGNYQMLLTPELYKPQQFNVGFYLPPENVIVDSHNFSSENQKT
jgi:hypothetical protein